MMSYSTKEDVLQLGKIDREFKQYIAQSGQPQGHHSLAERKTFSAQGLKRLIAGIEASGDTSVTKTKLTIPTSDSDAIPAVLYQPCQLPKPSRPLIVLFHGGGFCVASAEAEELNCRAFVRELGATCLSVGYRLAPEHKFPTAAEDAWDSLRFAAAQATTWGCDLKNGFVVGGNSAGGNLAAMLTHRARDEGLTPPLTGQFLSCPWLCPRTKMPEKYQHLFYAYQQNENAPMLDKETLDMYEDAYKPDYNDDRFDVFNHSKGHAGLPPVYMRICGMDPFRDEGLIYEKILRDENGIATRMNVYPGFPHSYWTFYPDFKSTQYTPAQDMIDGMRWLLSQSETYGEVTT